VTSIPIFDSIILLKIVSAFSLRAIRRVAAFSIKRMGQHKCAVPPFLKDIPSAYEAPDSCHDGAFIGEAKADYHSRNPDDNPLYGIVAEQLETFLARQLVRDRLVPHFVDPSWPLK
jgi:hypothetical protein